MTSTSCKTLAQEVLDQCVAGTPPRKLPRPLVQEACGQALFGTLVEGLADRFEPSLCDAYSRLFSQAVAYVHDEIEPGFLVAHYERVRRTRPVFGRPHQIYVLSRVTLGADIAVTSVMLSAAKRRFPHARLVFVGPSKNYELFAGDPHVHHAPVEYRRGSLRDRLAVWDDLKKLFSSDDAIVIDPDSRLTQLGLLPVCEEHRYHLFESRAYGADSSRSLSELAAAWAAETFATTGARPYVSLGPLVTSSPHIAVSLGVGDNHAKRLPDPFEEQLLALLGKIADERGLGLCIDRGAGGPEAERVTRAVEAAGVQAVLWEGSFGGFARMIAGSRLYVGYDSAGQHVAAACGVPLVCMFAGFPAERMFQRWRPSGPHCHVLRIDRPDPASALEQVEAGIHAALHGDSSEAEA